MDGPSEACCRDLAEASQDTLAPDQQERPRDKPLVRKALGRLGRLPAYWTIGKRERDYVAKALRSPLSGYLGGKSTAGYWCTRLSDEWSQTFDCRYAVPCNSATSGLLAACLAAGIEEGDLVLVSDYTMSASATCALLLGAEVQFLDIDPVFFTMNPTINQPRPKAIIVTNLFGHPANLTALRAFCDQNRIILIEDNAQAPFAKEYGRYTGTIGHMGVFSLNVHKHIQCGEGGVVVTDDPQLAHRLDCAINHGELMKTEPNMGLNLRMTEPIAAIACAQLERGSHNVQTRINLAHQITDCFSGIDFVVPPQTRPNCVHTYYMWAARIEGESPARTREAFISALSARGVPLRSGYSVPLHRLFEPPEFEQYCPVTCEMEDSRLFCFEVCAYDPKTHHLKMMKDIIHQEAEKVKCI